MFCLNSVTKSFDGEAAVENISLAIPPRRTSVLIGPSGCGKSTIFGLMTGLIKPDTGTVRFEDVEINDDNVRSIRLRLGYVIQDGGLFPHLSGHKNICLMAEYLKWPTVRINDRIAELTELTRLAPEVLKRYPIEMSGGQRQRVSLMRALMLDPAVLLLDEPLGALDPMIRAEVQDDLGVIFRRLQKTVVLVTHDLNEALVFADRLILMNEGTVVQDGSPSDLFHRPVAPFVTRFIGAQRTRTGLGVPT